jgi:hypothetical protein
MMLLIKLMNQIDGIIRHDVRRVIRTAAGTNQGLRTVEFMASAHNTSLKLAQ